MCVVATGEKCIARLKLNDYLIWIPLISDQESLIETYFQQPISMNGVDKWGSGEGGGGVGES